MNASDQSPAGFHEVVGAFQDPEALENAMSALTSAGWDHSDLSLLAQEEFLESKPPAAYRNSDQAADDPRVPHAAAMSDTDLRQGRTLATSIAGTLAAFAASGVTILTGGAALAAIAAAALAGTGAAATVNAIGRDIASKREAFLREQVERGGILLWVRLRGKGEAVTACDILRRHGAVDVHTHVLPPPAETETSIRP